MRTIQVLSVAALLSQLAVGYGVSRRSQDRRTLYSNGGLQGAEMASPEQAGSAELGAAAGPPNIAAASSPSSTNAAGSSDSTNVVGITTVTTIVPEAVPEAGAAAAQGAVAAPSSPPAAEAIARAIAEYLNIRTVRILYAFFALSIIIFTAYRLGRELMMYIRTVSSLNNPRQEYYVEQSEGYAKFRQSFVHAPMFGHRRAQASRGGALPTRVQAVYLLVYLLVNLALSFVFIRFRGVPNGIIANQLKNRTGALALGNLLAVLLIPGRHNIFIKVMNLPFDTFNTLHRWFARMVVLLIVAHAAAFGVVEYIKGGYPYIWKMISEKRDLTFAFTAGLIFVLILIQASSPIRHAAYEVFKLWHILLVAASLIATYIHLADQVNWIVTLQVGIFFWVAERAVRFIVLIKNNIGSTSTRATVEALPGDAVKVTLELARPWKFVPGQHLYLYMPSVGFLQSHPFSVAWSSEEIEDVYPEKLYEDNLNIKALTKTKFNLIVRKRKGFTKKLFDTAQKSPGGKFTAFAMAEGPFGGHDRFTSYGSVMLVAGGVGITHVIPFIRDLVSSHSKNTIPTRRILLVWIIPRPDALNWIAPWMQEILHISGRRDCLRLSIYITKLGEKEKIDSPSETIQIMHGRPNIGQLMDWEIEPGNQVGALGVSVCGGGALADDVRAAVRERQMRSNIDFVEESFSW